MTTRFLLILIALFWSALASASEIINDFDQADSWNSVKVSTSQLTEKPKTSTKQTETNDSDKKSETTVTKEKRSRLGGMFELLLPSSLRDNH